MNTDKNTLDKATFSISKASNGYIVTMQVYSRDSYQQAQTSIWPTLEAASNFVRDELNKVEEDYSLLLSA